MVVMLMNLLPLLEENKYGIVSKVEMGNSRTRLPNPEAFNNINLLNPSENLTQNMDYQGK